MLGEARAAHRGAERKDERHGTKTLQNHSGAGIGGDARAALRGFRRGSGKALRRGAHTRQARADGGALGRGAHAHGTERGGRAHRGHDGGEELGFFPARGKRADERHAARSRVERRGKRHDSAAHLRDDDDGADARRGGGRTVDRIRRAGLQNLQDLSDGRPGAARAVGVHERNRQPEPRGRQGRP